jgi:hypothetical protein
MKFAKLFDLENDQQVLLIRSYCYNDEDNSESFDLTIRTDVGDAVAKITYGYNTEEEADKVINEYNENDARMFRVDMEKMFSDEEN